MLVDVAKRVGRVRVRVGSIGLRVKTGHGSIGLRVKRVASQTGRVKRV